MVATILVPMTQEARFALQAPVLSPATSKISRPTPRLSFLEDGSRLGTLLSAMAERSNGTLSTVRRSSSRCEGSKLPQSNLKAFF